MTNRVYIYNTQQIPQQESVSDEEPFSNSDELPQDPNLDSKLQKHSQYIIYHENPFMAWFQLSLQNPLTQIYVNSSKSRLTIIKFFTLLLSNCQQELLLCKIISMPLILQIISPQEKHIGNTIIIKQLQPKQDIQDFSVYVLSLMKSYLALINKETVKYMIFQDKIVVLETCIKKYIHGNTQGLVEHTSLGNCLLNAISKAKTVNLVWQGFKGEPLNRIYAYNLDQLNYALDGNYQLLEDVVLFLCDFVKSVDEQARNSIMGMLVIKLYPIKVMAILYHLAKAYQMQAKYFNTIRKNIQILIQGIEQIIKKNNSQSLMASTFFCRIVKYNFGGRTQNTYEQTIQKYQLEQKNKQQQKILELIEIDTLKQHLIQSCDRILQILLQFLNQIKLQTVSRVIPYVFKHIFLSILSLTLGSSQFQVSNQSKILMLKIYIRAIQISKWLLNDNRYWDQIIIWYENDTKAMMDDLLSISIDQTTSNEARKMLITLEYLRNFRYMIIRQTNLQPNQLRVEKIYYEHFRSQGWNYEPGTIINGQIKNITYCILMSAHNSLKSMIIEDNECLLLVLNKQNKVLINIRFKNIKTCISQKKELKLVLRGGKDLIIQFDDANQCKVAKDYIINKRERCRQKQLKFIHQWLKKLQNDTKNTLISLQK